MAFVALCGQQWALIRRYGITLGRTPIRNLLKLVIWPGLLYGLIIWILRDVKKQSDSGVGPSFVMMIPIFTLLTTVFHVYSFSEQLVRDKASEVKSIMLIGGLKRYNYYCAMSICSLCYLLPISWIGAIILKVYLFDDTISWTRLILVLTLFALHLDAFITFAVSFITSSSYVFIVPMVVFFENLVDLGAKYLIKGLGDNSREYVLFAASFSPYEALRLFYNDYMKNNDPDGQIGGQGLLIQEQHLIIIAQIFWIIVFRSFACWFEEVCPWQSVSAIRSACFCFGDEDRRFTDKIVALEEETKANQYFERRIVDNRDIGIQVAQVTKEFGKKAAVSKVSFSIYKGETTLLLGHNGAGKSTLMNIILGLLRPDSGKVRVRAKTSIGVCPQTSVLDDNLTVRQHLELFNDIKSGIWGRERQLHIKQTLDDVNLTEHASKRPDELSGGMRRKLSLGMAFVGKSEVLILDEPSSGLDPDSRTFIWNAIRRYRAERTVLLSTQHMEEADYLGDRIAIMSAGQIVCCGSSVFLNKTFGTGYKLRVECRMSKRTPILNRIRTHFREAKPSDDDNNPPRADASDPSIDFVVELKSSGSETEAEMQMIELLRDLEDNKEQLGVTSFGLKSSSIEDVMLQMGHYFGNAQRADDESTQLTITATEQHLKIITQAGTAPAHRSRPAATLSILSALCSKQIHIYWSNKFAVFVLKLLLPVMGLYNLIYSANEPMSMTKYWQNPMAILLVGHFVYFPTRERSSKFKIVQLNSDATSFHYWLSWFIFDLLSVAICLIGVNIFLTTTLQIQVLVPRWQLHALVTGATLMFCLASMMLCYLLTHLLNDPKTAYGYVTVIFAISTVTYILVYLLRLAVFSGQKAWIQDVFGYMGAAFLPNDAYLQVFIGLSTKCYLFRGPERTCRVADGPSPIKIGFLALGVQFVAYAALLYLIETQRFDLGWYTNLRNICSCCCGRPSGGNDARQEPDVDVQVESAKAEVQVANPRSAEASLIVAQLEKSYVTGVRTINQLSFSVRKGECFGLLGVNGAGKTTTFSMLVGDVCPDKGKLWANGEFSSGDLSRYRQRFGYDPQPMLDTSLTPHQALYLMARLRGVSEARIPAAIEATFELLSMTQHAHKVDATLSGGTKKKLALGMALIGNPSVLALDEPTAGVDPLARRGVWQLLKSLRVQNQASIVISSHAMEECEAICDRISIMARGRLRCIGTFLHLRSKFAKGFTLRIRLGGSAKQPSGGKRENSASNSSSRRNSDVLSDQMVQELQELISSAIGPSVFKLADRNVNSVTFEITNNSVRRSLLFRLMHDYRQRQPTVSYMLNDSSLESIFISLAKEQQELEKQNKPKN